MTYSTSKSTKVIICAGGGLDTRWKNYLGTSKHMIPAYGEPLIHRLQRQLIKKFDTVHVCCAEKNKEKYLRYNNKFIASPDRSFAIEDNSVIWSYRHLLDYSGTTILLFADTFYTDEIIAAISTNPGDNFYVYGRFDKSTITDNQRQGEVFAYVIPLTSIRKYLRSVQDAKKVLAEHVKRGITIPSDLAKYSYKRFCGIDYSDMRVDNTHWIEWDDLTDDFDFPGDWDTKAKLFPEIFYVSK